MNVTVVLGALAIVAGFGALWWAFAARPSPARVNLFAGLPEVPDRVDPAAGLVGKVGTATRRHLPRPIIDGLELKLVQAGHPGGLDLTRALGLKVVAAGSGALAFLVLRQPIVAVIAGAVLFFLPDYWLASTRDKRQSAMQAVAADTIDQLMICLEAGLGFDAALNRVASSGEGPLTDELRHTIRDIQAGMPRAQALHALADRTQIGEIRQLVTALIQAQKHGIPLAETLRIQAGEMRLKRRQRTEERAAKLAVKMIFPIVVCFLPVFLIITLVPALISLFQAL